MAYEGATHGSEVVQNSIVISNSTADQTLIAAPAAGSRIRLTDLIIANEGAVAGLVVVKDGSTILARIWLGANQTVVCQWGSSLRFSDASAVLVTTPVAIAANIDVSGVGYRKVN